MRGKITIFIDGNNLFHAARAVGVEIDYAKLLNFLRGNSDLLRAFFYTGVDERAERQQGFLLWMRRNGYRVVEKELKTYADGTKKANLDVEIAVDMLSLADKYDTAVLVSGDEDFAYAINAVAYKGVRVELAGFRTNTSPRLIDVADQFIELDAHVDEITKNDYRHSYHHNHSQHLHNHHNHHSGHLNSGNLNSGNLNSASLNQQNHGNQQNAGNGQATGHQVTQPLSSDALQRVNSQSREVQSRDVQARETHSREVQSREVKSTESNCAVRVVQESSSRVRVIEQSREVRVTTDNRSNGKPATIEATAAADATDATDKESADILEETLHDVGMKRLDGVLSRVVDE